MKHPAPTPGTLRGAIVGYGFISSRGHVPAYAQADAVSGDGRQRTRFEIVAVADVSAARREEARRALPAARIYEDHESMLAAEAGRIDFVDVTTPPSEHARIARAALALGLHVLCEKPVATSVDEMRLMIAAARDAKRVLFPCHNYKHAPVIKAIRGVLESGDLGTIHLVTLDTFRTTHAKGVAEWQPDWRRQRKTSGGGIAMDHGSHTFYLAFDWLASQPTSITAKMSNLSAFDTEDNFNCTVTFPTGIAVAQLTWNAGFRKVIYTIHGANGALKVEDDDIEIHRKRAGGKVEVEKLSAASHWMDASHAEWFKALQVDFRDQIGRGEWIGREARDAAMCVQLIETAYASARADGRQLAIGGAERSSVVKAG